MSILHLARKFEIKDLSEKGEFSGYGSVFGVVDSQYEVVQKGAFQRSLGEWSSKGGSPALLWMHDPTIPAGVWDEVKEDDHGLALKGRLALDTQKGAEAYALLKMGALTGLSIGYRVVKSSFDAGRKARLLTDVDLFEISLVTFPANDAARVDRVKTELTERDAEEALRDAGFSRSQAKAIVAEGFKGSSLRDAADGLPDLAELIKRNTAILQSK